MQLAADLVGLLGVLFFAVPAYYANGLAWLSARLANLKVVFADPGQEARRQKIIADLAAQQDAWTPWKAFFLIAGIVASAASFLVLIARTCSSRRRDEAGQPTICRRAIGRPAPRRPVKQVLRGRDGHAAACAPSPC
ncbi:MAG: hypothetical protein WDN03_00855 [Rhizomicrobium sp.]